MTTPAHSFIDPWLPCVICYDDVLVPPTAAILLHVWEGRLDDESAEMTVRLWAMDAAGRVRESQN